MFPSVQLVELLPEQFSLKLFGFSVYSLTTHSLEKAVSTNLLEISSSSSWWVSYGTMPLTCPGAFCLSVLSYFKVSEKHIIVTPLASCLDHFSLKLITTFYPRFDFLDVMLILESCVI